MKRSQDAPEPDVIDVIEEFDYSTQNDAYNDAYKSWRRTHKNKFVFNFRKNPREVVYSDSRGFENKTIANAEHRAISSIMHTIGIAMLMIIFIDTFVKHLLVLFFNILGFDIHSSIFSSGYYGGSSEIVGMVVLMYLLRMIVPTVYIYCKMKLPLKVAFMSKLNSSVEVINSIALTLMVCTLVSLPAAYSSDSQGMLNFFKETGTKDFAFWQQEDFILYVVFEIIICPVISEIFFRGAMFAVLRQFGDIFAIIITAVTSCILTRDFTEMPAALLISAVASIAMLRSGSIITAFFIRIIYRMYCFTLMILEGDSSLEMLIRRNTFMLTAFVISTAIFCTLYLIRRRSKQKYLSLYNSHTSASKRYYTAFTTFPYVIISFICLLEAALSLFL